MPRPPILLVTCGNYGLRFVKWQYYLRAIGVTRSQMWRSRAVMPSTGMRRPETSHSSKSCPRVISARGEATTSFRGSG